MKNNLFSEKTDIKRNIENSKFLRNQIDLILKAAEEFNDSPKALSLHNFMQFYKTGSRKEYEYEYFLHRKRLCVFAGLAYVYEDKEIYLMKLEEAVSAILDEFTWALPAHIPYTSDALSCIRHIDLFAAETGFTLAEIIGIFGNRLNPLLQSRIKYEVRRRIFEPYMSGVETGWDALTNNWSAVCAGSVGGAFLYLAEREETERVLPRIYKTLGCYLDGFGADGACVEGLNYWIYGFGYYIYFARLLYQYTDGKSDLLNNEKVRSIALFPQKLRLENNRTLTFSDCGGGFIHQSGLQCELHRLYGAELFDDTSAVGLLGDSCYRFAHFIRDLAWKDCDTNETPAAVRGFELFKDAQWYIKRAPKYELAAKGGSNAESHNHNDIGGFLLNASGEAVISDPGRGEYSSQYFGEGRYELFAPSARAHSIPVINGIMQSCGADKRGVIKSADDSVVEISLEEAYADKSLRSLVRRFEFCEDRVIMKDRAIFSAMPVSVTEHFVTETEPVKIDGGIAVGKVKMLFGDADAVIDSVTFAAEHDKIKKVYTIDIELTELDFETEFKAEFII